MNYFYNMAAENRTKVKELIDGRFFFEAFSEGCFCRSSEVTLSFH